jgi:predicted transcriptional regulator
MNVSGSAPIESAGISVRIVDFLDKFANDVPIDFLAQELGRRPERLMEDLKQLEERGVVRIDHEQQRAALVREEKKFRLGHLFQALSGVK